MQKFQDLEEERINYTKNSLFDFANIASTICVSDDEAWEKIRLSLEDCDEEKDIVSFINESGTGSERPGPPKFIDFCRGDADTLSQTSEDDNYTVAQFARTMNPAFRSSSPAPSAFESHHDPNNPLAREMGLQKNTQPIAQPIPQDEISVKPRNTREGSRSAQGNQTQANQAHGNQHHGSQPQGSQHNTTQIQGSQYNSNQLQSIQPEGSQHNTNHIQDVQPHGNQYQGSRHHENQLQSNRHHESQPQGNQSHGHPPRGNHVRRDSQPNQRVAHTQRTIQPDPRLIQAQEQARQHYQQSQVPHNDYPADGMTQFCRINAPSDRSALPSPVRPGSRDSQSECSNATSFSSVEPPSGSASPGKPMAQSYFPEPSPIEESSMQKKRAFFNSPFARRKSRPEIESPSITPTSRNTWAPSSRRANDENTSPTRPHVREARGTMLQDAARSTSPEPVDPRANFQLNVGNNVFDVASPDKKNQEQEPKSPEEELDPIAQALEELKGVTKQTSLRVSADRYHGLATPQPSSTPAIGLNPPVATPAPLANVHLNAAKRGTPPPSYEQPPPPMSLLGAPKPAHTSRQMQKTTQMYVSQRIDMFNGGESARSSSRSPTKQEPPRATSPAPPRAVSPRPALQTRPTVSTQNSYRPPQPQQQQKQPQPQQPPPQQQQQQQPQSPSIMKPTQPLQPSQPAQRPASRQAQPMRPAQPPQQPKPQEQTPQKPQQAPKQQASPATTYRTPTATSTYAASNTSTRPRAPTTSTPAGAYGTPVGRNSYSSTRGGSPSVNTMPRASSPQPPQPAFATASSRPQSRPQSRAAPSSRAVSPQPQFRQSNDRPSSSRGSDMAIQLAPAESERGEGSVYGGSQRGRGSTRPQSAYYSGGGGSDLGPNSGGGSSVRAESRVRSKSLAEPKNYNSQGRVILNYCKSQQVELKSANTNSYTARAMYTYAAQIPEELGFQKGDILAVLRLQDDGWWEAEAVGKSGPPGLVPSNYLQAC